MTNYDKKTGTSGTLRMVITYTQSQSGNYTLFDTKFQLINSSSPTFAYGIHWTGKVAGTAVSGTDDVVGSGTYTFGTWNDTKRNHSSDGTLGAQAFSFSIPSTGTSGIGGPTTVSASVSVPRIGTVPSKPGTPTFSSISTRSVTVSWSAPSDDGGPNIDTYLLRRNSKTPVDGSGYTNVSSANNRSRADATVQPATTYYYCVYAHNSVGYSPKSNDASVTTLPMAPILTPILSSPTQTSLIVMWEDVNGPALAGYEVRWSKDPSFPAASTSSTTTLAPWNDTYKITGLTEGTLYYISIRARTASANSSWSAAVTLATSPKAAPTISVVAQISGRSATVKTSTNKTNFVNYVIQRQLGTTGTVTQISTNADTTSVTGLTPGATYRWRASAIYANAQQTDWSAWVTLKQPNPNTSPGDYFDGATADSADIDYQWTGTVNKSKSVARGWVPTGWAALTDLGGNVACQRSTGGMFGNYSVLYTVISDQNPASAGYEFGMTIDLATLADVVGGATYWGSIHVQPSRPQPMRAVLVWSDAAGVEVGRSLGDVVAVTTDSPTRLIATGTAPIGAVHGRVSAMDAPGSTGWSIWVGGDTILADGIAITLTTLYPYFDGSTPNDASYLYSWLDTTNASQSIRMVNTAVVDPLADPDCPPPPTPPRPPVIDDACIDTIIEWQRYWGVIKTGQVAEFFDSVPIVVLTTGDQAERQVRVRFYANPFNRTFDQIDGDDWCSDQVISYIPANSTLTIDGVSGGAWAEVSGGAATTASHLLYGSDDAPPTWPVLTCGISYFVVVDTPSTEAPNNVDIAVELVGRYQ